jgi:hypothetical protein
MPRPTLGTEVCRLLAAGLSVKEAAVRLKLEPWQAHEQLEKLRRHMKCATTFQLLYQMARKGLRSDVSPRATYMREYRSRKHDKGRGISA